MAEPQVMGVHAALDWLLISPDGRFSCLATQAEMVQAIAAFPTIRVSAWAPLSWPEFLSRARSVPRNHGETFHR